MGDTLRGGTTIGGHLAHHNGLVDAYLNGNKIWHEGNDGSGSGLIADLLDDKHASDFSLSGHTHSELHTRSHTMTSTSDHTAGAWKLFYSDASGYVTELGLGTSGQVLKSNGAAAAPTWQADNDTNTTYSVFNTTTDGLVPKTTTSNTTDFLRRDGTWATPPGGSVYDGIRDSQTTSAPSENAVYDALAQKAPMLTTSATLPAAAGWYRIATSPVGIDRCAARFEIDWYIGSGIHGQVILNSGIMYGVDPTLNQTQYVHYDANGLTKARLVYHTTYTGNYAYLEVYNNSAAAIVVTVQMFSALGWQLVSPSTAGSIPAGYSNVELVFADGFSTEGVYKSSVATGTAPIVVDSTTVCTNLNAYYLEGNRASAFATSGHTHTNTSGIGGPYSLSTHTHANDANIGGPYSLSTHNHSGTYANATHTHTNDSSIGGPYAASSHGNHVPTTGTANNAIFLRNDNSWQTVTPANIGAAATAHTHANDANIGGPYSLSTHTHTGYMITSGDTSTTGNITLSTQGKGIYIKDETTGTNWHLHFHGDRIRAFNGSTELVYLASGDSVSNATTAGGLAVATGRNNVANQIVRTNASGYIDAGWINTTSGDNGTTAPTRIYASHDEYIRYYTPANFISVLGLLAGEYGTGSTGVSNYNTIMKSGVYHGSNVTGWVNTDWSTMLNVRGHGVGDAYGFQIAMNYWNTNEMYVRGFNSNSMRSWYKMYHSGNVTRSTAAPSGGADGDIWFVYV